MYVYINMYVYIYDLCPLLSTTTSLHMELLDQREHSIERYFKYGRMNQYHLIIGKYGNLTLLSRYIDVRSDNKVDLERKMGYLYVNQRGL